MKITCSITPSPRPRAIISRADADSIPMIEDAELTTVINDLTFLETYGDGGMVFETTSGKLRTYVIYGDNTGDYDQEAGKYQIPVTVSKINHFDPDNADIVDLYPDTDDIVKVSGTTAYTKQKSLILEVQPNTWYTVYVNSNESYLTARVAGYSAYPAAGDTALWTDRDLTRLTPPINTFFTTEDTHYIMVYFSYRRDDVSEITPTIRVIKGSADFTNTVVFLRDTLLGVGQEIRYEDTGIDIPTPTYGDCRLTVNTSTAPFDVRIQYDTKEVPLNV